MSLLTVLKNVGKDLSDVEKWISEGLTLVGPIIGTLDPPLAPIIAAVERILAALPAATKLDARTVQGIVTSVASSQGALCAVSPFVHCPSAK